MSSVGKVAIVTGSSKKLDLMYLSKNVLSRLMQINQVVLTALGLP